MVVRPKEVKSSHQIVLTSLVTNMQQPQSFLELLLHKLSRNWKQETENSPLFVTTELSVRMLSSSIVTA